MTAPATIAPMTNRPARTLAAVRHGRRRSPAGGSLFVARRSSARTAAARTRSDGQPGLLGARADQGCVVVGLDRLPLLEAEGDHGDVVAPAGLVGACDQLGDRVVERFRAAHHGGDPVVLDHRREAVGAEQEHVVGTRAEAERVDVDRGLGPERPGDDRALRVVLGLLVGDPALAAQLLDQRVVGSQHAQLAVAPQVGAAVADVGERDLVALDDRGGQRRPHPGTARVVLGEAVDALVGGLGDRAQVRLRGLARRGRRARTTPPRSAMRPRPPGRRPSRRRPRTAAPAAK